MTQVMMKRFNILTLFLLFSISAWSADYYWVGGSGDWSDISHWATTSGGTTQHNVVPSPDDRVIFDANSFTAPGQVVTVNNQIIYCLDMIWQDATNAPRFEGPADFLLNVYGSMLLNADMTFNFLGDVRFIGNTTGHQIDLAGHTLKRVVTFNGMGGEWTLATPFATDSLLIFNNGTLNSADQSIGCEHLQIKPGNNVSLNLGTSQITVTGVPYPDPIYPWIMIDVVDIYPVGLTLDAFNSTLELTSRRPTFFVHSFGDVALGNLLFSNTNGNGRLFTESGTQLNFQSVEFRNDTELTSVGGPTHNFGRLTLGAGKNFIFQSSTTYIIDDLNALGTCAEPIQLFSNLPGVSVTFVSDATTIAVDFTSLRDIHGTGSANYIAENSADLGNNNGWNIMPKANNQLYWVGGTGDWYDAMNWSTASGGPGGACVPTAGDDVFFDANSFDAPGQVVSINVENAYCRSMNWTGATGNPSLAGVLEHNMRIFGSLALIPNMQLVFEGDFYFEGNDPGNTITSAGNILKSDVFFSGLGEWILQDSLVAETDITFNKGTLNTNDQKVVCQYFNADFAGIERNLLLGKSHIVLRWLNYNNKNRSYTEWIVNSNNMNLEAENSTIEFDFFGSFSNRGARALNYNVVVGNLNLSMNNWGEDYSDITDPIFIDTLINYSNGYYSNRHNINVWQVTEGYVHAINIGDTIRVNEIIAPDACTGMVEIKAALDDNTAYLEATQDIDLTRFIVQDVHNIGAGTITASNSIDLGNTDGWVFMETTGRELYWVGDGGNWNDTAHWSLSSGGPGGECIPTPLDNVYFDANSFSLGGQNVSSRGYQAYCKNMDWTGVTNAPNIDLDIVTCFGSITLAEAINAPYFGSLQLRGKEQGNTVNTFGHRIFNVYIRGAGEWTLLDSLTAFYLSLENGYFNSNGAPVNIDRFVAPFTFQPATLQLGGSHWYVNANNDAFTIYSDSFTIIPDSSLIELTSPNPLVYSNSSMNFHNMLFSNLSQTSRLETFGDNVVTFNRLEFRNNGIILGEHVIDSLIFSPGKAYQLDVVDNQTVNEYFQVIGNNCTPIELSSTLPGTQSTVVMNGGTVRGDFIQMRDQIGSGSTEFFAGANSTNISNSNTGWIFESAVEYSEQGILGDDVVLCNASQLTLDANTFNPNEQYRWQDGSTDATFVVTQPGTYVVEVTYDNSCVLRDSVTVLPAQNFAPDLPANTTLCAGETLVLDPGLDLVGLRTTWQDGSTDRTFTVTETGMYKVTLELSGCEASDSLEITYNPIPVFDLGDDQTLCPEATTVLDANFPNANYLWQDGSTNSTFTVRQAGVYTLNITENGCTGQDSVEVFYNLPFNLNIGTDTTICENDQLTLGANVSGASYSWSDGSSQSNLTVNTAGIFWLDATLNGCTERDSITISTQDLPRFDLGDDFILCEGETATLDGTTSIGNATYAWNNGTTTPTLNVNTSGVYSLTATLNGCAFSDEVTATFQALPIVDLGADQTLCAGETATLDATNQSATYQWQDGSTNAQFTVRNAGTYNVVVNLNGCTQSDEVIFNFNPLPDFHLGQDTTLCEDETLTIDASVPNATFNWNDGSANAVRTLSTAGLYWLEATLNGCAKRDSIQLEYVVLPDDLLGADVTLCEGEVLTFSPGVPNATYEWQDGTTASEYVVVNSGTYSVTVRVSGCSADDSMQAMFNPLPRFELGGDTTICQSESVTLRVNANADAIIWQDGTTGNSITANTNGTYSAQATLNGCTFEDALQLTVQLPPQFTLGPDTTACDDAPYVLRPSAPAKFYRWSDGSTDDRLEVTTPGIYTLEAIDGLCAATESVSVDFRSCVYFEFFAPNAFSPNGDGVNDEFQAFLPPNIIIESFEMSVLDRWGNLIFTTDDATRGWDGRFQQKELPTGVYVYVVTIAYQDDRGAGKDTLSGDVLLVR